MKKLISFLLAIVMMVSLTIPVFAEETGNQQYGIIRFEFSDTPGSIENLDVMVLDGFVYTNAESFCSRMGYDVEWGEASDGEIRVHVTAFSDLWMDNMPTLELQFVVNDTTVYYNPLCGIEIAYTAPAPCVQNERGTWIPLSYTLNLLGGSRNIAGDVLVIHRPSPSILSVATVIAKNKALLSFDWADDFDYDEKTVNQMDGAARIVTLFNGLLELDGRSWSCFIDWDAFDKKFGKTLATMMCTHSVDELQEYIEDVEGMLDVFDPEGAIGSMLHSQQAMIDSDVNAWEKICEEKLAQLQSGSGTLPQYNMAYQQYERATKKQDLFSAVGADDLVYIQDALGEATTVLDWATKIGYGVTYLTEFQARDDFQATVLMDYFATRRKTEELDDATAWAIENYASSGLIEYSLCKFLEEHALEVVVDESGMDALMGIPANLLLLAWGIMSENIPFYSDGLNSVKAREISNYAQQVQNDASVNVSNLLQSMRTDSASITPEDCVRLAEYCYVYLKACSIARDFAIASLEDISEEAQKKLQSKIEVETNINQYIAEYLAILGQADVENSCYILGFLPQNNKELLGMYSDDDLVNSVVKVNAENGTMKRKLTQINQYDADGNLQEEHKKYYNENGMLTSEVNNNSEFSTYVYDSKGYLIEYHQIGSMYDNYFTYNEKGQRIKADLCYGMAYYEYDSVGRLCKTREEWDIGTDVTVYVYDTEGKLIGAEITCTEENGSESDEWVETVTYTYDSENRLIQEICEGEYVKTSNRYDYTFVNLVIDEYLINDERSEVFVHYYDTSGNDVCGLSLRNPRFYANAEGYLAKIVDTYLSYGKIETTVYEFYYDDVLSVSLDNPSDTSISCEEVITHTYEEAEKLLYEYLGNDYGFEGLEVRQVSEMGRFEMAISGENGAPIYIIHWYTVNLDTGEVRDAETYSVVCDLW